MTHGGRRPGAGRKPAGETKAVVRVTVNFTPDEADALEATRHGKPFATHVHDLALSTVRPDSELDS